MIASLDHLVLTVGDLERTLAFYRDGLGMIAKRFKDDRWALHFGEQKINLHIAGKEFEPKAEKPVPGSADLCFLTDRPLQSVTERLAEAGIDVIEGPVARTGAKGPLISIYCRDPDGNLIEIARPE
ncbi:MAG: VOC family protein [Geminicoccaceae bacterium]